MLDTLIFRADADHRTGTGHVMRCLALAKAWQAEGGRSVFVSACDPILGRRISEGGCELVELEKAHPAREDLQKTADLVRGRRGAALVLDGYQFDAAYQQGIKQAGIPLVVIDDFAHTSHYVADIVINQNLGAEEFQYSCEPYTRLLRGPQYALLRPEFDQWRGWERVIREKARRILVTLGGIDLQNMTRMVLDALAQVERNDLDVVVAVGAANPHLDELKEAVGACSASVRLERGAEDMASLMACADLAVSGGGITCWEMAFMGLPNGIIVLAENQRLVAEALEQAGVSCRVGAAADVSGEDIRACVERLVHDRAVRCRMSARGRDLVDGLGTRRVLEAVKGIGASDAGGF